MDTQAELIESLKLALPYVEKVANTAPTTPSRTLRKMQAIKDANAIREAIARHAA
jgi:hypothetical protein